MAARNLIAGTLSLSLILAGILLCLLFALYDGLAERVRGDGAAELIDREPGTPVQA